jgi:protein SCO1
MNRSLSPVSIGRLGNLLKAVGIGAIAGAAAISMAACSHSGGAADQSADLLSATKLVDQNGNAVTLDSLKGKPMVVDFIYTSCPGPCMMETAKLANVAVRLGPDLGSKFNIVSITVDPEHDGPKQLLDYAHQQGADAKGWYFLTGSPTAIDQALAGFKMAREREPNGEVGHIVAMMLIGPDGTKVHEYNGEMVKAQEIVDDLKKTLNNG